MLFLPFGKLLRFYKIKFVTPFCGLDEAKCFPSNGHTWDIVSEAMIERLYIP
jgi:hypothetical protein